MTADADDDIPARVEWDGTTYLLDMDSITGKEYAEIQQVYGLKPWGFLQAFLTGEPDGGAMNSLAWLFQRRAGSTARLVDVDVPTVPFTLALVRARKEDVDRAAARDADGADPKVPAPSEDGTTPPSSTPTATTSDSGPPSGP